MKKFFIISVVAMALTACTQDVQNQVSTPDMQVGFAEETRVQLNEECKTVWNRGDMISVFNKNDANSCWRYRGADMTRNGAISLVSTPSTYTTTFVDVYGVYPYNADYSINMFGEISLSIPAEQNWKDGSYGVGDNIMVALGEDENLSFRNIFGWLKLQVTGDESISQITFRGNNNESLTGAITYDPYLMEAIFSEEAGKDITLICPEVALATDKAQIFYIAIAPQTFTKGFTVEITTSTGEKMTKSSDKSLTIERNTIQPMAVFDAKIETPNTPETPTQPTPPNNEFWYTSTRKLDTEWRFESDGDFLYHDWDPATGKGVIAFDGDITSIIRFHGYFNVTSVTMPNSITSIKEYGFADSRFLESVVLSSNIKKLNAQVFFDCGMLQSITLPDNLTSIGYEAFGNCKSLKSITIPDKVTSIGDCAFLQCIALESVTLGYGVTTIGAEAFYGCSGELIINSYKIVETDTNVDTNSSWLSNSKFSKLIIGDKILKIGKQAFYNYTPLKSVTISNSVTEIGRSAFSGCYNMTSITIGNGVTSIGDYAFDYCESLRSITIPDSVTSIGDYAFKNCTSLTSVTLGKRVTSIGKCAFAMCSSMESITFPDSVTSIGNYAFEGCTALESVTLPGSITSIGSSVFSKCSNLTAFYGELASSDNLCLIFGGTLWCFAPGCNVATYSIPDSVTSIGGGAFLGCSRLANITIPDSVTSIGAKAFYNCSELKEVYCKPTTPPTGGDNMFSNNASGRKIYVPTDSARSYRTSSYWSAFSSSIYGYEF